MHGSLQPEIGLIHNRTSTTVLAFPRYLCDLIGETYTSTSKQIESLNKQPGHGFTHTMRLLNATTQPLQFETFYYNIPSYAILSHTWGAEDEEATFQDLRSGTGRHKPGYLKIKACCEQAVRDGLRYVWIDTCCIDKTNSVELQEAINSMFGWYKRSTICYAYLCDSKAEAEMHDPEAFHASKWFMRGWTLQELIAPAKMVFYDRNWACIGSRTELGALISSITRISTGVLAGEDLELSSVAQRMCWASMRKTTRAEDMAYSLIGIFGVHMPLIYGEGGVDAFIRLQKAIMEQSDDHSLFAWRQEDGPAGHGLLATSPALFSKSLNVVPYSHTGRKTPYRMTNRGLKIQVYVTCTLHGGDYFALLGCKEATESSVMRIAIAPMKDGRFVRIRLNHLGSGLIDKNHMKPVLATMFIPQRLLMERPPQQVIHIQARGLRANFYKSRPEPPTLPRIFDTVLPRIFNAVWPAIFNYDLEPYETILTTKPGRANSQSKQGTLEFDLMVLGRVGVLLVPSYGTGKRLEASQAIVVVFGVNIEGYVYVDIVKYRPIGWFSDSRMKTLYTQPRSESGSPDEIETATWFDHFIQRLPVDSSKWTANLEAHDMFFSAKASRHGGEGKYQVVIVYGPISDK